MAVGAHYRGDLAVAHAGPSAAYFAARASAASTAGACLQHVFGYSSWTVAVKWRITNNLKVISASHAHLVLQPRHDQHHDLGAKYWATDMRACQS